MIPRSVSTRSNAIRVIAMTENTTQHNHDGAAGFTASRHEYQQLMHCMLVYG